MKFGKQIDGDDSEVSSITELVLNFVDWGGGAFHALSMHFVHFRDLTLATSLQGIPERCPPPSGARV